MVPYFLATGFSEIWLQPSGELGLIGVAAEVTFLRGALDKLGIEPQLDKRYEYKNAADRIMNQGSPTRTASPSTGWPSPPGRASSRTVADVPRASRPRQLQRRVDTGPLTPPEALEAGLIDRIGYRDEVYADVRRRVGGQPTLRFADRWSPAALGAATSPVHRHEAARAVVALIEGHGGIVTGRSRRTPFQGQQMGSDTISRGVPRRPRGRQGRARWCSGSTPPAARTSPPTRCGARSSSPSRPGNPSSSRWAPWPGPAATSSPCPADVDRRAARDADRIDRRVRRQGGRVGAHGKARAGDGRGVARPARADVLGRGSGSPTTSATRLSGWLDTVYDDFIGKVAAGRRMDRGCCPRDRTRPGLDRCRRGRDRPRRLPRWAPRRGRGRAGTGRAGRRRAGAARGTGATAGAAHARRRRARTLGRPPPTSPAGATSRRSPHRSACPPAAR